MTPALVLSALALAFAPALALDLAAGLLYALLAVLRGLAPSRRPRRAIYSASIVGLASGLGRVRPVLILVDARRKGVRR